MPWSSSSFWLPSKSPPFFLGQKSPACGPHLLALLPLPPSSPTPLSLASAVAFWFKLPSQRFLAHLVASLQPSAFSSTWQDWQTIPPSYSNRTVTATPHKSASQCCCPREGTESHLAHLSPKRNTDFSRKNCGWFYGKFTFHLYTGASQVPWTLLSLA